MEIETIIKASARITRITELSPGDVYKRIEAPQFAGDQQLIFGIVTDIMSNGDDAAIIATEITKNYAGGPTVRELKVYTSTQAMAIFPATPEEIVLRFEEYREEFDKKVTAAEEALEKANNDYKMVDALLRSVESANRQLSTPQHRVLDLGTFNAEREQQALEAAERDADLPS